MTRRRVLGRAHPETIRGQVLLAFTLHLMGRADEAIELASEAEALAVDNFGPDHELTLGAWDCLGQIVASRGEFERGENLLRQCISGREHLYGALDGSVIDALYNLAKIVRREGQLKEAKTLHLEALNRGIQTYGITHISCSMHMHESMSVLKEMRATAEIRDLCQEWLGEMVDVPREDDPYTRRRRSITLAKVNLWLILQTGTEGFDADLAVRAAREAASLTDSAYFWSHVGLVLERANRPLEAVQALKTATGRSGWTGGGAFHWLTMARLQLREGDLVAARESYERSLDDPDESWREDLEVMRGEVASLLRAKSDENPRETSSGTKPRSVPMRQCE